MTFFGPLYVKNSPIQQPANQIYGSGLNPIENVSIVKGNVEKRMPRKIEDL